MESTSRFAETKNIYCIGRNYTEHAKELGNPVPDSPIIFLKSPAALRSLKPTEMAYSLEEFDFEAELVLVLDKHLPLNASTSFSDLAGISLGLDLTRRQVQSQLKAKGHPWALAKNFKGSAVLTNMALLTDITEQTNIEFSFYADDKLKQQGHSKDMLFSPIHLLNELLKSVELFPNDLVFTGTPKGVGKIKVGTKLRLECPTLNIDETGYL